MKQSALCTIFANDKSFHQWVNWDLLLLYSVTSFSVRNSKHLQQSEIILPTLQASLITLTRIKSMTGQIEENQTSRVCLEFVVFGRAKESLLCLKRTRTHNWLSQYSIWTNHKICWATSYSMEGWDQPHVQRKHFSRNTSYSTTVKHNGGRWHHAVTKYTVAIVICDISGILK